MSKHQRLYPLIAILACSIFVVRCIGPIFRFSPTIDEPYHLGAAVCLYESGKSMIGAQHPPLARVVMGIPLKLMGVKWPDARGNVVAAEYPAFDIGKDILYSGQVPFQKMIVAMRFAMLIFPLITFFLIYQLGKYLANSFVGMTAVILTSIDPTVLGHAFWIGTDAAGCAGFVASLYFGIRWIAKPTSPRAVLFAVVWGLAIGCKYNCLLVGPMIGGVAIYRAIRVRLTPSPCTRGEGLDVGHPDDIALPEALSDAPLPNPLPEYREREPSPRRKVLPTFTQIVTVTCLVFLTLWIIFRLDFGPMAEQAMFDRQPIWISLSAGLKNANVPMPSFWLGLMFLLSRAKEGHATYLLGDVSFHGWVSYYPIALLVKSSVAFLVGLIASSIIAIRRRSLKTGMLLCISLAFFLLSVFSKYQLGMRHLLPVIPLVCIVIAMTLRKWAFLLIFAGAMETAVVHPNYLAFFNIVSGGTARGERYLIDSNLDWGQDTADLAHWLKQNAHGRPYAIRVFAADARLIKALGLTNADPSAKPTSGLFAISANVKHRLDGAKQLPDGTIELGQDYSWREQYPVVKRIGASIEVYDLDSRR